MRRVVSALILMFGLMGLVVSSTAAQVQPVRFMQAEIFTCKPDNRTTELVADTIRITQCEAYELASEDAFGRALQHRCFGEEEVIRMASMDGEIHVQLTEIYSEGAGAWELTRLDVTSQDVRGYDEQGRAYPIELNASFEPGIKGPGFGHSHISVADADVTYEKFEGFAQTETGWKPNASAPWGCIYPR